MFATSIAHLLQEVISYHGMVRERQDLEFRSVRWQFGQAVAGPSPIIMLKSDCGWARNDDSRKLIEL